MTNGSDKQELIRKKAYAIWETEGRPDGQEERHWQQAEAEVDTSATPLKTAARKLAAKKPSSKKPAAEKPSAKDPAKRRAKPAAGTDRS